MMATVPHVTSVSGLRKFLADGFFLEWVYSKVTNHVSWNDFLHLQYEQHVTIWQNCIYQRPGRFEKHILQCSELFHFLSLDVSVLFHCCLLFLYYYYFWICGLPDVTSGPEADNNSCVPTTTHISHLNHC
jgi:hypothetical protein